MKQIICLAGQPWSSSPGRTQQLLSRLRDTQVLYFSPAAGQLDRSYLKKGKRYEQISHQERYTTGK